jgi:pimeloyl-ACP methyl ester carboxylesterase
MAIQVESTVQKSTIVRSAIKPTPVSVRAGFGLLELLAPALGARWAERLWFAVPGRPPALGAYRIPLPGGERYEVSLTGGRAWPIRVVGESWGEGPVVYLMHGWGGHRGQLSAFVGPLIDAGFRVVAFDAPGHGESAPGRHGPGQSSFLEFEAALAAVVRRHGPAHAVVAHSGGAPAAVVAVRRGLPVERLVFVAPMGNPESHLESFARQLGFGHRTRERLVRRIVDRVGVPMSHFDIAAWASGMATTPLLVVHDRDDVEVGWPHGAAIAEAWPGARLLSTSGLGHRRILRAPQVVAEVMSFVGAS